MQIPAEPKKKYHLYIQVGNVSQAVNIKQFKEIKKVICLTNFKVDYLTKCNLIIIN